MEIIINKIIKLFEYKDSNVLNLIDEIIKKKYKEKFFDKSESHGSFDLRRDSFNKNLNINGEKYYEIINKYTNSIKQIVKRNIVKTILSDNKKNKLLNILNKVFGYEKGMIIIEILNNSNGVSKYIYLDFWKFISWWYDDFFIDNLERYWNRYLIIKYYFYIYYNRNYYIWKLSSSRDTTCISLYKM